MIIPDYNKGTVNVHLKLDDVSLPHASLNDNNVIAVKAFEIMTGLKPRRNIFTTESLDIRIYGSKMMPTPDEDDVTAKLTYIAGVVSVQDDSTADVIVTFDEVIGYDSPGLCGGIISIIDFLYKYKDELMTSKSSVII